MGYLIVSILLMIVTDCVLSYAFDSFSLNNKTENGTTIVHQPDIFDLNDKSTDFDKNQYVTDVVIPSSIYFYIVAVIDNKQTTVSNGQLLCPFLINIPLVFFLFYGFCCLKINLHKAVLIGLSILICIVIGCVISKVYEKSRLKAYEFGLTREEILQYFVIDNEKKEIKIAQENNYLIAQHSKYIMQIKASVEKRYILRKILIVITYAIFLMLPMLELFVNDVE